MDLRNVIFAIALSFAVLFGWSVIFETPEIQKQKKITTNKSEDQKSSAPSVNLENPNIKSITREDAIKSLKELNLKMKMLEVQSHLKGALIDDITFKKYNETINNKKVTYLNPLETNDGYFVETGWAASNLKKYLFLIQSTIWKQKEIIN